MLKAGFQVAVWNRTRSKALPLVEYGAQLVSTTDDLKEVLFAEGGLVTGKQRPKLVIDSSSISQEGSIEVRARLEALGIGYLCAPVSGNAKVAKAGKLLVVVSGPLVLYESAKPSLQALGRCRARLKAGRSWKWPDCSGRRSISCTVTR